jgi:hypothetical protein
MNGVEKSILEIPEVTEMVYAHKNLLEAVTHLYNWQTFGGDNFHSRLYEMFQKADNTNILKLITGFQVEAAAWSLWRLSTNQDKFFAEWGLR